MKKIFAVVLSLTLLLALVGCVKTSGSGEPVPGGADMPNVENNKVIEPEQTQQAIIDDENEKIIVLPNEIQEVKVSGYYNGSVINEGDFVIEDFDVFTTWFAQLSLEHRTFEDGKTPSETQAGGNSYTFNINDGEVTFTYADGGTTAYIIYDEEWYEVLNPTELPFEQK